MIGAGIVGAACAYELSQHGRRVLVIDDGSGGATHAGMGHLVVMDDNPAELALSCASLALWRQWLARMDSSCGYSHCGTLWIAADAEEMQAAADKQTRLQAAGIACALIDAKALAQLEPALRNGLAGALQVGDDGVVYAPNAARWLLAQGGQSSRHAQGISVLHAQVSTLEKGRVCLSDGSKRSAPDIVLAAGLRASDYLPCLGDMHIIRTWAGFRAATPDGLPLIGPHPHQSGLWLALGHEGLGVTTATATAQLIASGICASGCSLDGSAYVPARLMQSA